MANSGFQFKQFFIAHQHCAMKVGTDSILLGSWADPGAAESILDIGTGSGLLAIMLAQKSRSDCMISGLDIDADAIEQAQINGARSPWAKQLEFRLSSIQNWHPRGKYELIITNPPYFDNPTRATRGTNLTRLAARQTLNLSHQQLISRVAELLSDNGRFYCVLPVDNAQRLMQIGHQHGLYCDQLLIVAARPQGPPIRYLMAFTRQASQPDIEHLSIYTQGQTYSPAYKSLCRAYYLNF